MRNPVNSHRSTEANAKRTENVIEKYLMMVALRQTWDMMPDEVQIKHHSEILDVRAKERKFKNYLAHRAGPDADL